MRRRTDSLGEIMSEAALASPRKPPPTILKLGRDDIYWALKAGWRDFRAAPAYGLAVAGLCVVGGWAILGLALASATPYLAYPLMMGFALTAPFIAAGVYEVSRRLETGEPLAAGAVLRGVLGGGRDLGWMALVTGFGLVLWLDFAFFVYLFFYGLKTPKLADFALDVVTTQHGALFLLTGNLLGAAIAFFMFSLLVVSCPLLLDRDIDFVTAMVTSLRVVRANPIQMMAWAALIALFVAMSLLSGLLGLFIAMPALGHGTWHIYRRAVAPP